MFSHDLPSTFVHRWQAVALATIFYCVAGNAAFASGLSCPTSLTLANDIVSGRDVESACGPISVGPNFTVLTTGELRLQSTGSVALKNGLSVQNGGTLRIITSSDAGLGDFAGGIGSIPDDQPAGLGLNFTVSGLVDDIKRVRVRIKMQHDRVGDLTATLTAPSGVAKLVLFGKPGHRPAGNSGVDSNFAGAYVFEDYALESLWDVIDGLGTSDVVPEGSFRTSTAAPFNSGVLLSNAGGCSTYLSGAFAGLTPAQANGTWTLTIVDSAAGSTGAVLDTVLQIEEGPSPPNRLSGFIYPGECTLAPFDMTGTGRTSYAYLSNDSGFLRWNIIGNDGSATGQPQQSFIVGNPATDVWIPADFDGDGIADAAVWTPDTANPPGQKFAILRSSRPLDSLLELTLGAAGDNPTVWGDFDGDGVVDPSVIMIPDIEGEDIVFHSLLSSDGGAAVRELVLGQRGPAFTRAYSPGDVTGDGIDDMALFSDDSWTVFDGRNGNAVGTPFSFGLSTDPVISPGDVVGNDFGDFTRVFVDGSDIKWQTRDGQTGVEGSEITHGATSIPGFSEFATAGDFDGDGKVDYAVWRRDDANPNVACTPDIMGSRFIIRQSSDLNIVDFCFGESGGAPLPGANAN